MVRKTTKRKIEKVTFAFAAPKAGAVLLLGDFTQWEQAPIPLKKSRNGVWKTAVPLSPGHHEYRFMVDGEWKDDPQCQTRIGNRFGTQNCVCEVAG